MIPPSDETRPGSSQPSAKPTLEALLRVKRAERPDAAFWADFERGLAQKQLAAIVEPRPWWLGLALVGRRVGAFGLPISATAAALLAVMVVRTESPFLVTQGAVEFGPVATAKIAAQAVADGGSASIVNKAELVGASLLAEAGAERSGERLLADVSPGGREGAELAGAEEAIVSDGVASARATFVSTTTAETSVRTSPLAALLDLSPSAEAEGQTASQLTIEQNLAAVTAEAPELVAEITPSVSFASSLSSGKSDLSAVGVSSRQARLLAMADMPELDDAGAGIDQVRERMVHRLTSDESNYAAAGRLGYGADRLSLRF